MGFGSVNVGFSPEENVPGGVVVLGSDGKIPGALIPDGYATLGSDGKLAESRARLLRPPAPTPLVADGIIRGRTRSRTAALRAQSASRVLGSSSPPMGV